MRAVARRQPADPHRGFDHLEFATHGAARHAALRAAGSRDNHPEAVGVFYTALDAEFKVNAAGGGDTDAPQVNDNPIQRGWYHTDWVADRTIAWLDSLAADDDWFCWMSFPDPHHPWDPPAVGDGARRLARRRRCPPATRSRRAERERDPRRRSPGTGGSGTTARWCRTTRRPAQWVPATLTDDQVREVNARNAVECELIDEALGPGAGGASTRGAGTTTST